MLHRITLAVFTAIAFAAVAVPSAAAQQATAFSGRATAVSASILGIQATFADTGALPAEGGRLTASTVGVNLIGLLEAGALKSTTQGQGNQARSTSSAGDVAINLLGLGIAADAVTSRAVARCQGGEPRTEGSTRLAGATILGQEIAAVEVPNVVVPLPLGFTLTLNEQTSSTSGQHGEITVTAAHLVGPGVDVAVARSHADVDCAAPA